MEVEQKGTQDIPLRATMDIGHVLARTVNRAQQGVI